jgi:hypothetical protein
MTINWDSVFDLIGASKIPDWDKETVGAAVTTATEKWWEADLTSEVLGVELFGRDPFPYKIDLLTRNSHYRVIDWKTKKAGKLDQFWEERERRSPQHRIYAAAVATKFGPEVFPIFYEVRGVELSEKPKTRVVSMKIDRPEAVEAVHYLRGVTAMRKGLIERKHEPWVREVGGCRCFGPMYACEFEKYCFEGKALPEHDPERVEKEFSHSSASEFLRCPERYRLLQILGKNLAEDVGANGDTFHRAMEMIYNTRMEGK